MNNPAIRDAAGGLPGQVNCCPTCGHAVSSAMVVDLNRNRATINGAMVRLTPTEAEVLHVLVRVFPESIAMTAIVPRIYGETEPLYPYEALRRVIRRLRVKLSPVGASIHNIYGGRYFLEVAE